MLKVYALLTIEKIYSDFFFKLNNHVGDMLGKYLKLVDFLYQIQSGNITKYQPDFRPGSFIQTSVTLNRLYMESFLLQALQLSRFRI